MPPTPTPAEQRRLPSGPRQRGIVLAIALILLAVIGIGSMTAMKSGIFGNMVVANMSQNQMALQAAEAALRFCERQAMATPPGVPIQPVPLVDTDQPRAWSDIANWAVGSPMVATLPAAVVDSAAANVSYNLAPQCMVERMELRTVRGAMDEDAFLVTARGFSPNYRRDGQGVINGSEVWVQSTIRFTP